MSSRTAFRLLVMMACSGGIAYGATRIDDLPPPARNMLARLGKWIQRQAETEAVPSQTASSAPFAAPPPIVSDQSQLAAVSPIGALAGERKAANSSTPLPPQNRQSMSPAKNSSLEAMAGRLQQLGAAHYHLEKWGAEGRMFRFCCELPIGQELGLNQHFEAIAATSEDAVRQVLDQVAARSAARYETQSNDANIDRQ